VIAIAGQDFEPAEWDAEWLRQLRTR